LLLFLFTNFLANSQTANYISNGSFENLTDCNLPDNIQKVKNWRSIDSVNYGNILIANTCYSSTPYAYFGFQYPRTGNGFVLLGALCQPTMCATNNSRGYLRNRLKNTLQAGQIYCVSFYVNISENSSRGIDALGIYFGDNTLDTITYINKPLNYLIPQVQNPTNNIIIDTLVWVQVTGTFVATGNEKHCVIGNFKNDVNVNSSTINHSSAHIAQFTPCTTCSYTNVYVDDVSCIPLDLPAYAAAGPNVWAIPGNTLYLGRQKDVGIDEACKWYKLPNTTSVVANAAGLTLTVAIATETYMVKQDICGIIKYDTVVVYASGTGFNQQELIKHNLNIFPNPTSDVLYINSNFEIGKDFTPIEIVNSLGQLIREEEIIFKDNVAFINTKELANGVYVLNLRDNETVSVSKRFVIAR